MKIIKQETEIIGGEEFSVTYFSADGVNVTGVLKQLKNEAEHEEEPTQADRIEESQLVLMEAVASMYEESLENRLNDQEVQATIYETLLEMGGN